MEDQDWRSAVYLDSRFLAPLEIKHVTAVRISVRQNIGQQQSDDLLISACRFYWVLTLLDFG